MSTTGICELCLRGQPHFPRVEQKLFPSEQGFRPGLIIYSRYFRLEVPKFICESCLGLTREYLCQKCHKGVAGFNHQKDTVRTANAHGFFGPPIRDCIFCGDVLCEKCTIRVQQNSDFSQALADEEMYIEVDHPACSDCLWTELNLKSAQQRVQDTMNWLTVYFALGSDCSIPVLEALHFNYPKKQLEAHLENNNIQPQMSVTLNRKVFPPEELNPAKCQKI